MIYKTNTRYIYLVVHIFLLTLFIAYSCEAIASSTRRSKKQIVSSILQNKELLAPRNKNGSGSAYTNIALCKYWGKRNEELNLPFNSSLSVTLPYKTNTTVSINSTKQDLIILNGKTINNNHRFAKRTIEFLDLFRPKDSFFTVKTKNDLPTASGLATSASGMAALVIALDDLFDWKLNKRELSVLARLGSGSASRSVNTGIVEWNKGVQEDGMDSYASKLDIEPIDNLRIGIIIATNQEKEVMSQDGMKLSVLTSPFYLSWRTKADSDFHKMKVCIKNKDIICMGKIAESNALAMHSTSITSSPSIMYWNAKTIETMHKVWQLRNAGISVYFTIDAGPHVKLIFDKKDTNSIKDAFADINITRLIW